MAIGKKTGGRVAGTPNKLSLSVKDNVIGVFEALGGADHMKRWAEENPNQFYNIYAKLLPLQLQGGGENGEIEHSLTVKLVE
jgi:hypothetical protein